MIEKEKLFWKTKTLEEMSSEEWEALCDRCGRCCLLKFEREASPKVYHTGIACSYLDIYTCRCTCYRHRIMYVPDCIVLTSKTVKNYKWLPPTCAYRLLSEGKSLEWWHPLVSGDPQTVHRAGISVRGKCISAKYVQKEQMEAFILDQEN